MTRTLEERFTDIWERNIRNRPYGHLQAVAEIIEKWKQLLPICYKQLENNTEDCSRHLSNAVGIASRTLVENGFYGAALDLLRYAWIETGIRQQFISRKIYRAAIAFYLSEMYLQQGDKGAAFWWQLHALADDYLEGGKGGGARIVLETVLGMPTGKAFSNIEIYAADNRNLCKQRGWNRKEGFAEDVIVQFAIRHPEYASIFAFPTNEVEFPISSGYLKNLLTDITDDKLGKKLKYTACYLFMHLPGCTPASDLRDEDQVMQTDVVIRNLTPQSNLIAETFGRQFPIECKNWSEPVGSSECGYFLQRLQLTHCSLGVILAKNGITGSRRTIQNENGLRTVVEKSPDDYTAAAELIRRSFHETGVTCVVLNLDDLEKLANKETTLRITLFERVEQFRFGNSKHSRGN